ncbi:hypothetical protein [Ligilactobacillus saerimneri]|uniref:hypothetical protein n=1 Tax=Ligilactobacillus saerimneri TaxID=228229 RepID=UPI0024BAC4B9|nr:hypothetical protein [Ligilactobacillus saerimneri]
MGKVVSLDRANANKLDQMNAKSGGWTEDLKKNKSGAIKANSLVNIELILENDIELKNTFKFNEFTTEIDVVRPNPRLHFKTGQLVDAYIDQIASYIEQHSKYGVLFDKADCKI